MPAALAFMSLSLSAKWLLWFGPQQLLWTFGQRFSKQSCHAIFARWLLFISVGAHLDLALAQKTVGVKRL